MSLVESFLVYKKLRNLSRLYMSAHVEIGNMRTIALVFPYAFRKPGYKERTKSRILMHFVRV